MFRLVTLFVTALLCLTPATAPAQQRNPRVPAWDAAFSAGSFHGRPHSDPPTWDTWYHEVEARVSLGRYWGTQFKTEVEFGATGEGSRYVQRLALVPGLATPYPYTAEEFFRVRQGSARAVWQFFDNQWIHPYVFAGLSLDAERRRARVPEQFHYSGDPRLPDSRLVLVRDQQEGPYTTYRPGLVLGAGAKCYVSPRVFLKAGGQAGFTRPARSISLFAGMGFDF